MKAFLRGAALLAGGLVVVTLALFACTLGYSLVACHGAAENPVGWALFLLIGVFLGVPVLTAICGMMVLGVAFCARATFARFGVPRVLGGLVLLLVIIAATTAGIKAAAGAAGGCSILGAAAAVRFG